MATPTRLSLLQPIKIWLVLNGALLVVISMAGYGLVQTTSRENKKLIQIQTETLVRSRHENIERGDYR